MRLETELAKASMTRVDRRDPYKLKHKMKLAELNELAPNFDWKTYYATAEYPQFEILNVATPGLFQGSQLHACRRNRSTIGRLTCAFM